MRLSSPALLLAAAGVLDGAAALYFFRSHQDPSNTPRIVALALAAVVTVGALIAWEMQVAARQQAELFSKANQAVEALAHRAELTVSALPLSAPPLAEARGQCMGIAVVVSVRTLIMERLSTTILFPRRMLDDAGRATLARLVEQVSNDDGGLLLRLDRPPRFGLFLSYERVPETDVDWLYTALRSACELLARDAGAAARPPAG